MRSFMALLAAGLSTGALAQIPTTIVREGCLDALLVSGESYDFSAGAGGHGANLDWLHCTDRQWGYLAGASTFSIADSHWNVGRAGATFRFAGGHVASATLTAGSGRNAAGSFSYRKIADGASFKATERLFAKVEHEYFDIDKNRGNVLKLGAIVLALPFSLDVSAARSLDGNLPTRSFTARVDWVASEARAFAGFAHGRLAPRVEDVVSGERVPDAVSREVFGGAALKLPLGELIAAIDTTRTGASRRTTLTLGLRIALP